MYTTQIMGKLTQHSQLQMRKWNGFLDSANHNFKPAKVPTHSLTHLSLNLPSQNMGLPKKNSKYLFLLPYKNRSKWNRLKNVQLYVAVQSHHHYLGVDAETVRILQSGLLEAFIKWSTIQWQAWITLSGTVGIQFHMGV